MNPRDQFRGRLRIGSRGGGIPVSFDLAPGQMPERNLRPGGDQARGPNGELLATRRTESLEIKILATSDGAKYAWKRVHPRDGTDDDDADGGGTEDGFYALEINGVTDVPENTVVTAFYSDIGPYLVFTYGGATSPPAAMSKFARVITTDGSSPYAVTMREITWDGSANVGYTDVDSSGKSDFEAYEINSLPVRNASQFSAISDTGVHEIIGPDDDGEYFFYAIQAAGYTASDYKSSGGGAGYWPGFVSIDHQRFKGKKWFGATTPGSGEVPGHANDGGLWTSNLCITSDSDTGTADSTAGSGQGGYDADRWTFTARSGSGAVWMNLFTPQSLDSNGKLPSDNSSLQFIGNETDAYAGVNVGGYYVVGHDSIDDPFSPGDTLAGLVLAGAYSSGAISMTSSNNANVFAPILYVVTQLNIAGGVQVWDGSTAQTGATGTFNTGSHTKIDVVNGIIVGWS